MAAKGKVRVREQAPSPKRQAGPAPVAAARPGSAQPIELPDGMWESIARKAYELWEQRGRPEGRDLENWLDAEAAVMEAIHEARE